MNRCQPGKGLISQLQCQFKSRYVSCPGRGIAQVGWKSYLSDYDLYGALLELESQSGPYRCPLFSTVSSPDLPSGGGLRAKRQLIKEQKVTSGGLTEPRSLRWPRDIYVVWLFVGGIVQWPNVFNREYLLLGVFFYSNSIWKLVFE